MSSSGPTQQEDEIMRPAEAGVKGHEAVDLVDVTSLLNRTQVLETGLTNISNNLTNLTTLVNQLVQRLVVEPVGGGSMESPPIEVSRPTDQVRVSTPQDGTHLFKHMKPPMFRSEDRDRNKDSVMTFLQKWRDVHDLRKPDESVKIQKPVSSFMARPTSGG